MRDPVEQSAPRFSTSLDEARRLDAEDELTGLREHFACPPDLIRMAPSPLYDSFEEVRQAVFLLREVIERRDYERFEQRLEIIP